MIIHLYVKIFITLFCVFFFNNSLFANNSKNLIFFSDVQNDEFYKYVGISHLNFESLLNKHGLVIQNSQGQYQEFIFDIKEIDNRDGDFVGDLFITNTLTGTKKLAKFRSISNSLDFYILINGEINYFLQLFKGGDIAVWYESSGMRCFNEMNPQCNKLIEENKILGFTDRKNNFSYEELVQNYKINQKVEEKNAQEIISNKNELLELLELGYKYFNGDGVDVDYRKSVEYWELAAQQGLAQAQLELGISYMLGEGVNKDLPIAYMWLANSIIEFYVIQGSAIKNSHRIKELMLPLNLHQDAKEILSELFATMPSSDLIAGTSLGNQCWKNKFQNCKSNYLNYSKQLEKKMVSSGLPMCPEDDPKKLYQIKWDNCFGTETFDDGIYEGEYRKGNFHGKGMYIWNDGDKYVGEWVEQRIEGLGSIFFANGSIYEGMLMDGVFEGIGKFTNSDGAVQEGIWENGNLTEEKIIAKLINVDEEYVALQHANIREEPFIDSQVASIIEKGTTILVLKKTDDNEWFLIKEIKKNLVDEDIGNILGYSSSRFYQSLNSFNTSNTKNNENAPHNYSLPPGQLLLDAYLYYTVIKKMYEVRQGYSMVYINDLQMSKARNQVEEIENILLSKFELDGDMVWNMSKKKYKEKYSTLDLYSASGTYTEEVSRIAKIVLISFDSIAKEVIGDNIEKDF